MPEPQAPKGEKNLQIAVELEPVNGSDQPVMANFATANIVQGLAYLDFGFIEPGALALVARSARDGKPTPKALKGRLSVRVALGMDVLLRLNQQLNQAVAQLRPKPPAKP